MSRNNMKITQYAAPEDRKIIKFPGPYKMESTSYHTLDFCGVTKKLVGEEYKVLNQLKICKVIVIGDVSVGKTCIVNRFCQKLFDSNYKTTIGVDFEVERFDILNVPYNLQIWDTAGQERFKSIAQAYYRGTHVIVVVFDLTNLRSLMNCKTWLNEALFASASNVPFIFLVGSKRDLLSHALYKQVEITAIKVAQDLNAEYWNVSSKTGKNVNNLFYRIAALSFDRSVRQEFKHTNTKMIIGSDLVSFKKNCNEEKMKSKCDTLHCL